MCIRDRSKNIGKVYAGKNGILGVLREDLIDTSREEKSEIKKLIYTPGGAFGSCRYRLKDFKEQKREYKRIMEVFKKYNIDEEFYSQETPQEFLGHQTSCSA